MREQRATVRRWTGYGAIAAVALALVIQGGCDDPSGGVTGGGGAGQPDGGAGSYLSPSSSRSGAGAVSGGGAGGEVGGSGPAGGSSGVGSSGESAGAVSASGAGGAGAATTSGAGGAGRGSAGGGAGAVASGGTEGCGGGNDWVCCTNTGQMIMYGYNGCPNACDFEAYVFCDDALGCAPTNVGCPRPCDADTDCPDPSCGGQVCNSSTYECQAADAPDAPDPEKASICNTDADCKCRSEGATCVKQQTEYQGHCSFFVPQQGAGGMAGAGGAAGSAGAGGAAGVGGGGAAGGGGALGAAGLGAGG